MEIASLKSRFSFKIANELDDFYNILQKKTKNHRLSVEKRKKLRFSKISYELYKHCF